MRIMAYAAAAAIILTSQALSQSLHHHEGASPEVDQFYSYWLRPNGQYPRVASCCNHYDCYVPEQVGQVGGKWWFKHRETGRRILVPDEIVESMQADPRESPDGRNHVCASPFGHVYCFVAGVLM